MLLKDLKYSWFQDLAIKLDNDASRPSQSWQGIYYAIFEANSYPNGHPEMENRIRYNNIQLARYGGGNPAYQYLIGLKITRDGLYLDEKITYGMIW